jgi:hypothetical protein
MAWHQLPDKRKWPLGRVRPDDPLENTRDHERLWLQLDRIKRLVGAPSDGCGCDEDPTQNCFNGVTELSAVVPLLAQWRLGEGASPFLDTSGQSPAADMVKTATGTAMSEDVVGALPTSEDDGAVRFNAVGGANGDYLLSSSQTRLTGDGDRTLTFYVNPAASAAGVIISGYIPSNGGWYVGITAAREIYFARSDFGGSAAAIGPAIPLGEDTFVGIDWNPGAGVTMHYDGAQVYTDSVVQGILTTTRIYIGRRDTGAGNTFQGKVDEVNYWDGRLISSQHSTLFSSCSEQPVEVGIQFDTYPQAGGYLHVTSEDAGPRAPYSSGIDLLDTGGAGIQLEAAEGGIRLLTNDATGEILLESGNDIDIRTRDNGGEINVESDGGVFVTSEAQMNLTSQTQINVTAETGTLNLLAMLGISQWFAKLGINFELDDASGAFKFYSGANVVFQIDADGTVHILTGTSIVADL